MNVVRVHPLKYDARPHGHHVDLFKALAPYLAKRGHEMIADVNRADAILFDPNIWDLGADGRSGNYSPYDWGVLDAVLNKHLPIVFFDCFDYWGTPEYGCPWSGKDGWIDMLKIQHQDWARFMYQASRPGMCRILYFLRKMQISQAYPDWVFPLEYPLFDYYPMATKEQLASRPYDVCLLANLSTQRRNAMNDLYADGRLKVDAAMMPIRLPHDAWVDRHRQAKLFVECDASMGSERPQRLMTVAPMLRVKSDHRLPFPRTDLVHQVEVGNYDGHISRADVDKILSVVNNPGLLYSIYVRGAEHMERFYSMQARCEYIIGLMERFL